MDENESEWMGINGNLEGEGDGDMLSIVLTITLKNNCLDLRSSKSAISSLDTPISNSDENKCLIFSLFSF